MSVKDFDISRRSALLGIAAGASSLLLPSPARSADNAQAEAWKSIDLVRHDGTRFALNAVLAGLWSRLSGGRSAGFAGRKCRH